MSRNAPSHRSAEDTAVTVGAALQATSVVTIGTALGGVAGRRGAIVGALAALGIAAPFARVVARTRPYDLTPLGVWRWLVDTTWSAPNTFAGALFLAVQRARGNSIRADRSRGSGTIDLERAAIPGYATTIGPVVAGSKPRLDAHERVHVTQARLFGPLYGPLVVLDYARLIVWPSWWDHHDHERRPIHGVRDYLQRGVYPRVWHERWAYSVAPADSRPLSFVETLSPVREAVRRRLCRGDRDVSEWAQQDSNL